MQLLPVVERLQTQTTLFNGNISGAASYAAAAADGLKGDQAAWVIPVADAPGANALENGIEQRVAVRFGVVVALRNVSDARGDAAIDDLEALRIDVRTQLLGWIPPDAFEVITRGQGRMLALDNMELWWLDEFLTAELTRAAVQN